MESKVFGYVRVSTQHQYTDRQVHALQEYGVEERNIFIDMESGKNLERTNYQALRNTILRRGDTLIVKSLDRLSRNKADIRKELEYYKEQGIRVKILDLPTTMTDFPENQQWIQDLINNILIEVLGTISEQERLTMLQRQKEGYLAARKRGTIMGRPKAQKPENWDSVIAEWHSKKITARQAQKELGLKSSTFYKLVAEEQNGV